MNALPAQAADQRPMTIDDLFAFKRITDPQISPDGKHVVYVVTTVDLAGNKSSSNLWIFGFDRKAPARQLTTTTKKDRHPRWSPDGTRILFESNRSGTNQLWVIDLSGGEAQQLTTISTSAGTGIWSPDGKKLAFVSSVFPEFSWLPFAESDKKNKEKLEAIEKNPVKAKVFSKLFFRHWDEYVEDKRQHLFVCNADGTDCRDVTPGDRDANPTSSTFSVGDDFTFSPDGSHLVFTAVPPKNEAWSTNYQLCRVSLTNTKEDWEALTKNPAADVYPRFSPDGKKLAWRAQKKPGYEADKWDIQAVDCNPDGSFDRTPKNLTEQKDVSPGEFAWTPFQELVFVADENATTSLFTVSLDGNVKPGLTVPAKVNNQTLTAYPGGKLGQIASLNCAKDGRTWVHTQAHITRPADVYFIHFESYSGASVGHGQVTNLNDTLLAQLDSPKPESVEVAIEDGKMQMWILKPPGFDPNKKWPVAYLVHGGPQGAWEDNWSYRWCPMLWAAQGYVVVLPNPRGSTGFGQKFTDQISGDWGGKCYRDLMAGADYVEKLPYVDKDRIASAGASFGGYMMNWFAVTTGRFKTLITHCSVWNFESMWGTTDELWFDEWEHAGLPWEVPGKYREFSPHIKAANLGKFKTPMLIIHNDFDFRCPIGQGLELFTSLQRQGVPSRFVNFPDEGHWVLKPANSKFWHEEVFGWLKKQVPPGPK
ncbi:MAG TPA: S9 family peptidase [Gemmatales bacterium]|nr:S9 family peptidase [Gemmatales bacterium]